jgi:heme oxygenase
MTNVAPRVAPEKFTLQHNAVSRQSLRHYLRADTAEDHTRLDGRLRSLDWGNPRDYRYFLEGSAGALLPIEDALIGSNVVRWFPDWGARSRRAAILQDIKRIGGNVQPMPALPRLDVDGVLGAMYVLDPVLAQRCSFSRSSMQPTRSFSPRPLI